MLGEWFNLALQKRNPACVCLGRMQPSMEACENVAALLRWPCEMIAKFPRCWPRSNILPSIPCCVALADTYAARRLRPTYYKTFYSCSIRWQSFMAVCCEPPLGPKLLVSCTTSISERKSDLHHRPPLFKLFDPSSSFPIYQSLSLTLSVPISIKPAMIGTLITCTANTYVAISVGPYLSDGKPKVADPCSNDLS